ncbi:MAG TPA: RIO1 family regulatory kinase/ATPase [Herpetosiphonaceae bacterium]
MSTNDETYLDDLEFYEEQLSRSQRDRKVAKRKQSARPASAAEVGGSAEAGSLTMTYVPARFEAEWLRASLASFYTDELISDVLASVKGGKEASVYRCQAQPHTGELLAAKVYRPRQFRNLRNDKLYRDGRTIRTPDGRPVKSTDDRLMRALGKKTAFGKQVSHTSWLMHEFTTLERLHQLGAAVPRPVAANDNALLMSYHGDASTAAPTMNGVRLAAREAQRLFEEVLRNIELMLAQGLIHGDLSAYNILYWEGKLTIIDFPQITYAATNRNAREIFDRDVTRVCEYFIAQGVRAQPEQIAADLWERYVEISPDESLSAAPM